MQAINGVLLYQAASFLVGRAKVMTGHRTERARKLLGIYSSRRCGGRAHAHWRCGFALFEAPCIVYND